jgi:tetratricopeptide (TPR) repeat protein
MGPRDVDLAELLGVEASDAAYTDPARAGWFYARSWALVHWLLEGEAVPRDAAANLITALATSAEAATALEQATGLGIDVLEQRVRAHVAALPAPRPRQLAHSAGQAPQVVDPASAKRRLAGLATLLGARRIGLDLAQESWIAAPALAEAAGALAEVLTQEARLDEADRLWQDAWAKGLAEPRLLVAFARRRFDQQDFDAARIALRRALERHPRYAEALALLVRCDLADRKVAASTLASVRAARTILPFRVDLIQLEAVVRAIRGQAPEALRLLQGELAALAPDLVGPTTRRVQQQAHLHRGFERLRRGDLVAARGAWEEALEVTDDPREHEGLRLHLLQVEAALSAMEGVDP